MPNAPTVGYRERALSEYEEKCYCCGTTEKEIEIHHRNGNRSDNSIENLLPVCTTCHRQIHNKDIEFEKLVRELGYEPYGRRSNRISVSDKLLDTLYPIKSRGENYEDVIWRLLPEEAKEDNDHAHTEGNDV